MQDARAISPCPAEDPQPLRSILSQLQDLWYALQPPEHHNVI